MKFISFPKIEQFRQVIKNINQSYAYVGQGENDKAIFDYSKPLPVLTAYGSVKLHGTNATVTYGKDGLQAQKRTSIISLENDNAGFAAFVEYKKQTIKFICNMLVDYYKLNLDECSILLPGEWAGQGIQKGVGISNIPKSWFIFADFKVIPINEEKPSYWESTKIGNIGVSSRTDKIYNVSNFETFEINIDFGNPSLAQNEMTKYVDQVEKECPISKVLGFPKTIGEGIVWTLIYNGSRYIWKTKGEAHSNSKVKTLKNVDNVEINKKIEIANKVCPAWRLEQMYNEVFDTLNDGKGDIKRFGEFIKAVNKDIIKEELDIITEAGFIPKDIFKFTPKIIKTWFNTRLDEESGLV